MTTIAYDHKNKLIACDSRLTADGVILTDEADKWKVKDDDSIWFFTGAPADDELLMALSHDDKPEIQPNSSALFVKDNDVYLVCFDGDYCTHTKITYNHAIGSGWKFALSAFDCGADAAKALGSAIKRDCYSGGVIRVYDINRGDFVE